jgi:hypothetical protein
VFKETIMGADLICYIAFGPMKIRLGDRKVNQIARQVREYLDGCIVAAERLLLGQKDVPDPRKGPADAKRSLTLRLAPSTPDAIPRFGSIEDLRLHPEYQDLVRRMLADCGRDVEAGHVFGSGLEDLAKEVRDFVAAWNNGCFRDLSYRVDPLHPRSKVVVAGELSWGDEPEGAGYQLLKKAFGLTVAQRLGVT